MFSSLLVILMIEFSCKNDEPSSYKDIVGTWVCSDRYYLGTDTFVFKKNGKMSWSYTGSWTFNDYDGTYSFNGSILTITKSNGRTEVFLITGITDNSFVLVDEDGYAYTYNRS